ncbi:MAG: helix-turn-helix domain-containing protein [Xanthomonadales bacterium]|nr:helix-turn-helix domain-containing protein [Xanthomonadales bacterium]
MYENTQLIRPAQVCKKLAISSTTLWRLVKAEKLKPIKISQRATAFKLEHIEKYIQQSMERDNA